MGIPWRRRVQYLAFAAGAILLLSAVTEHWQLGALGAGFVLVGVAVVVQARRTRKRTP